MAARRSNKPTKEQRLNRAAEGFCPNCDELTEGIMKAGPAGSVEFRCPKCKTEWGPVIL